jgi:hypothetical protein
MNSPNTTYSKPTFGGHETFVFRYGWLKKGVDALIRDPAIFTRDEALVILGVGKNMVRSIRYWCLATGLCEEARGKGSARELHLTSLASRLMSDNGWDPYLEDVGTLWLLHWHLVTNPRYALVWYLTFCTYHETEFVKEKLTSFIGKQFNHRGIVVTHRTIQRDVDVCLRTYVPAMRDISASKKDIPEETLDCPLVELDLLRFSPEDEVYRFNIGPKATLPTAIFGYALLMFLSTIAPHRRTVAVDECVYKEGSPGQVFKLDENSVVAYLEEIEELTLGKLRFQETAGLRQLYLGYDAESWSQTAAFALLERYYARFGN